MKLKTAFNLTALAVALASTSSVYAFTADQEYVEVNGWNSARDKAPNNADRTPDNKDVHLYEVNDKGQTISNNISASLDGLEYQYVDVGSSMKDANLVGETKETNQLTELYRTEDKKNFVVKISPLGSDTAGEGIVYNINDQQIKTELANYLKVNQADLKLEDVTAKQIADFFDQLSADKKFQLEPNENSPTDIKINTEMVFLAGLTKNQVQTQADLIDIRRLDSSFLEYAHESHTYVASTDLGGNLTNDNKDQSLVLANTTNIKKDELTLNKLSAGVTNGILNNKDEKHEEKDVALNERIYGLHVHKTFEKRGDDGKAVIYQSKKFAQVDADQIEITSTTTENGQTTKSSTVITSEGITTDKLTVGGVDVGNALGNAAVLGELSTDQLKQIVDGGTAIAANTAAINNEVQARIEGDAQTLKDAKDYTDTTVQKVTADVTVAANAYTDQGLTAAAADRAEIRTELAAGDAATLTAAKEADKAVLVDAKAYTDAQVATFGNTASRLNQRIDNVEETAYRGIAIALAAQQQIPNIAAGQTAVFGGIGHYEGESAAALGLATVLADGRTSFSGALGFAGNGEVGGRVGVAYVFGAK